MTNHKTEPPDDPAPARTLTDADVEAICSRLIVMFLQRVMKVAPAMIQETLKPTKPRSKSPSAEDYATARRHFERHGRGPSK